eukprot:CAMPEP_0170337160 /NCGR_PEP_ID=MMETSP0116_2-20130129/69627_1 /TAXON_ID=400756 /ORGANISM="Durinskia baltica, Strain CSIRO CS-38" /LENGTH=60 /DNA_ID=CAMNT_0010590557 /DNA_START=356 /DNA_END=535 /DNA_ORIENTATION=-
MKLSIASMTTGRLIKVMCDIVNFLGKPSQAAAAKSSCSFSSQASSHSRAGGNRGGQETWT